MSHVVLPVPALSSTKPNERPASVGGHQSLSADRRRVRQERLVRACGVFQRREPQECYLRAAGARSGLLLAVWTGTAQVVHQRILSAQVVLALRRPRAARVPL